MSQTDSSNNGPSEPPRQIEGATAFPWERLLQSALFAFLAWLALWLTVAAGVVYWIMVAVNRELQPGFGKFLGSSARYVGHCLAYAVMQRDDPPFPIGPWPSGQ